MLDFPNNPTTNQQFTAAGVTWTFDGVKWAASGLSVAYLPLTGGTMSGPIVLAADPTAALGASTKQYVDVGHTGGFVNKLRNGTFDVAQRGASGTAASGVFTYAFDGWFIGTAGAAVPWGTTAGRGPSVNAFYFQGAAGLTAVTLNQRIESFVSAPLGGTNVTFQVWIFNNSTGATVTPQLAIQHPTAADNYASTVIDLSSVNLQPCPVGVWTRVAYTFALPTASAKLGLWVQLGLGAVTSGALWFCEADLRATPGVPVGLCANPPPPELRPIATELAFCQRYYETITNCMWSGNATGTAPYYDVAYFKVRKRATPTLTYTDVANSNFPAGVPTANTTNTDLVVSSKTCSATGSSSYYTYNIAASAEL